eukprot:TRINITY_DN1156_c0_g2_i2.p2 TRINITY_DN1156_c0_g2~~TRINITY_DN1156_c0_g2_i2.p2  ORF type:complete len:193 (+),score=20.76 TRINITY_DN1156_c0_g2_i2:715-1293(+)
MQFSDLAVDWQAQILAYSHSNLKQLSQLSRVNSVFYRLSCRNEEWLRSGSNRFRNFRGLRWEQPKSPTDMYPKTMEHLRSCNSRDSPLKTIYLNFVKRESIRQKWLIRLQHFANRMNNSWISSIVEAAPAFLQLSLCLMVDGILPKTSYIPAEDNDDIYDNLQNQLGTDQTEEQMRKDAEELAALFQNNDKP